MAGIPKTVLLRADEMLKELEKNREHMNPVEAGRPKMNPIQLSMFQLDDPVMANIRTQLEQIDLNTISPIEALLKLNEIKKILKA